MTMYEVTILIISRPS